MHDQPTANDMAAAHAAPQHVQHAAIHAAPEMAADNTAMHITDDDVSIDTMHEHMVTNATEDSSGSDAPTTSQNQEHEPSQYRNADAFVSDSEVYQPGHCDGGRLASCYTEWRIPGVDWTQKSKIYTNLSSHLLDMLAIKYKNKLSQAACEDIMTLRYKLSEVPVDTRPQKYAQFLTFLQDQGVISPEDCQYVAYEYCELCGSLYAGDDHNSSVCLNPDCGCQRVGRTKTFIYRSVNTSVFRAVLPCCPASLYVHPNSST